jgi:hypothetical protein
VEEIESTPVLTNSKHKKHIQITLFQVLIPVVKNSSVFCNITLCSLLKITNVSHKHVTSIFIVKEEAKQEVSIKHVNVMVQAGFLLSLFFDPEDGNMFL